MKQIRQRLGEAVAALIDAQHCIAVEVAKEDQVGEITGANTCSKIMLDEAAELVALAIGMIKLADDALHLDEGGG
jgi:hypothetical protein